MTDSPTAYKLQLGATLQALRINAGLNREAAQECLGCSASKIVKIENGDVGVRPAELRLLLDLYGITEEKERADIEELGRAAQKRRPRTPYGSVIPDRFRRYFNLEETVDEIQSYDGELVDGLAQTPEYARAVTQENPLVRPADINRYVQARLARQERLLRPDGPRLSIIMSEGAIRREVGGRSVMRDQLRHLAGLSKHHNITIQVIPNSAGAHASTGFNFRILNRGSAGRSIVYLEWLTDAQLVDDPVRVEDHELVFRKLLSQALSPAATVKLLGTVASELDTK